MRRRRSFIVAVFVLSVVAGCEDPGVRAPLAASRTGRTVEGIVLEQVDGPPYSYLRLRTTSGETWVGVPVGTFGPGARVTVRNGAEARGFYAPRIGRRFDLVVFGPPSPASDGNPAPAGDQRP